MQLLNLIFLLALGFITAFDVSERMFKRLLTSSSVNQTGEITKTVYGPSRIPCAKECHNMGINCSGFEFDPFPDTGGNYKCDTVQYLTQDRIM